MESDGHSRQTGQPDQRDKEPRCNRYSSLWLFGFHFNFLRGFASATFAIGFHRDTTPKLQKRQSLGSNSSVN